MKYAKIPRIVPEATIMISSQKLSCSAGQWYFVRDRCTITSVMVLSVDAIFAVVRLVVVWEEEKERVQCRRRR